MIGVASLPLCQILLLGSLYITQYLGLGFFMEALVAILRREGVPLEQLGLVYLLAFFWVVRFLWSPFVDRFIAQRGGAYKGFLLFVQFILVLMLALISFLEIPQHLPLIFAACLLFGFFSATQSIATDALAFKLLSEENRGIGNSIKVSGNLLGHILGGGAALVIYEYWGWSVSLYFIVLLTLLSFIQLLFFQEPQSRLIQRADEVNFKAIWEFWRGARQKKWLYLLFLYPTGICMSYALITPILVDAGWGLDRIGFIVHTLGTSMGVAGALATGWMIRVWGRRRMLLSLAPIQALGVLMLFLPLWGYHSEWIVFLSAGTIHLLYSPVMTLLSTLMMDRISPKSPATEYALQHSLLLLLGFVAVAIGLILAGKIGYHGVILLSSLLCILSFFYSIQFYKDIFHERD